MAGLASYSKQTFNLLFGLAVSAVFMIKQGKIDFDIFGIYSNENGIQLQN